MEELDEANQNFFVIRSVRPFQIDLVESGNVVHYPRSQKFGFMNLPVNESIRHSVQRKNVDPDFFKSVDFTSGPFDFITFIHYTREVIMMIPAILISAYSHVVRQFSLDV